MSESSIVIEEQTTDLLSRPLLASINFNWEKAIYLLFIILAIITRFWSLGDRVMSHDESLHTQFSYQFFDGQGYSHTPLMHGPFLFHLTAVSYWLFGDSDFAARVPVAIFGVILVVMPYFLRPWIGRLGALFASFILLISPFVMYYSRYIRHDVYVIMWALIVFIAIWYYFREQKERYLWWFTAGTALMFSTKEVAFIYVAIFGSYLIIRLMVKMLPSLRDRKNISRLRVPLLVILSGIVLVGAGFAAQRAVREASAPAGTVEATEGFAVDPNAEPTAVDEPTGSSATEAALSWTQIAGIGLLSLGLFLAARAMRPEMNDLPEFDLIILFTTLLLPLASPLLTTIAGWNPTDYTLNQCQLAGQESMSTLQIFLARLGNSTCWSSYLESGVVRSGLFLAITMVVSILVGLWWNRRRWVIAALIFYSILLTLFTSVFTNLGGWTTGIVGSLGYWLEQQEVQRGSQPSFYYAFVVPFYEFLPLIFSLLAIRLWTQRQRTSRVLGYWLGVILLSWLTYLLTNWAYNGYVATGSETSAIPGILTAAFVAITGILYWILRYRSHIITEYDLQDGISSLFEPRSLLQIMPYLIWWLLLTWIAYSYAGEKMPWLSIHFVIPMAFMVGWYFNEKLATVRSKALLSRQSLLLGALTILWLVTLFLVIRPLILGKIEFGNQELASLTAVGQLFGVILIAAAATFFWRRSYLRTQASLRNPILILSVFTLLSILTMRFAYMASFPNADYTTEFMVYAHGAPATKDVVLDQVESLSMRLNGDKGIKVAFDSDVSWPLTWYLRDYPNRVFFGDNPTQDVNQSPVIIVGARNWDKVEPYLGNNYEYTEHTFLWWPMEEYRQISPNAILGDPRVPNDQRRGLANSDVREALWNIFFYRDYEKYGQVFGGTYRAGEWPLRHNLRLYVRNDTLPTLWDYGVGAVAAGGISDPYAEGEIVAVPVMAIHEAGFAGAGPGELSAPRNMAIGPDRRIYVLDSGNHRVQVFDEAGQVEESWGSFGTGPGQFNEPWGITVDEEFVYVADTWNHRLQKFTLDGEFVASFGESGSPGDDAEGTGLGLFFGPRSIILLDDGNLLVTDTGNHRMQLLDRNGNFLRQIGGFGNLLGQMNEPVGLSQGPNGMIYLTDTWNGRVQEFSADLFALDEWPVDAWEGQSINNKPYSAVDSAGRIYITDPEGYRVLVFNPDGSYLARFGSFGADVNSFGLPNGIAIDDQDFIYIADSGNNRILKFAPLFGPAMGAAEEAVPQENPAGDAGEANGAAGGVDGASDEEIPPTAQPADDEG